MVITCFQELQKELEKQQEHVNSLQNMVVVVDETNGDHSKCNKPFYIRYPHAPGVCNKPLYEISPCPWSMQ